MNSMRFQAYPAVSRSDRLPMTLAVSLGVHLALFLLLVGFWHRPLVLVQREVAISLDVSDVAVNASLGEIRRRGPATGIQKVKQFLEKAREFIPILNQENQPQNAGPSTAKPDKSREEIAKENREKLEQMLSETAEKNPAAAAAGKSGQRNEGLLNEEDARRAKNASSGGSGTAGTGGVGGSPSSGESGVFPNLVMNNSGRRVVFAPSPPPYPLWALRDNVQGKVILKVWFDKDGFPVGTEVVQSSGNSLLDATAKNHALKFRIEPIQEDREESGTFTIIFSIQ